MNGRKISRKIGKKIIRNERGQATTAALVLLPVILVGFCLFLVFGYAMSIEAKTAAACRSSMVHSQKEAAYALKQLLQLNPVAERLEHSRELAQKALELALASAYPPGIAAAQVALSLIEARQVVLVARQKYWLLQGRRASVAAAPQALRAIRESLPGAVLETAGSENFFERVSSPDIKVPRFHVISFPAGVRTPTYRTAPDFTRSQRARVQWLLPLKNESALDGKNIPLAISIGCSVDLVPTEKDEEWVPQISEDKLLSN